MDAYGIYQTDDAGARILACPVLINKEKRLNPSAPTSETEFPALSALSSGTGATWTQQITMKLPISIQEAKQNAAKQVKQLSWADKQQFLQRQEELYRAEMEEDMREDEFYYAQREWDRKQEAEIDEREAKRAFMSRQAAYQDEDDELDELDDMIWSAMMEAESHRS
uniref:Uncharacterized protein n=1 Tax=viral metagenome TaxID=1070528 RepID=A0A6C0JK50_9ZZZZ